MTSDNTYCLSWDELHRDSRELAKRLFELNHTQTWKGVICITRGGLIPGAILARELDLRLVDTLGVTSYDHDQQGGVKILKTIDGDGEGFLLVDDLVDTGVTAKVAKRLLPKAKFITVYAKPNGKAMSELFIREFPQHIWLHFPWDTQSTNGKLNYCPPLSD